METKEDKYYKFKAEILRAIGLILCSSIGIVFIEIFKRNFQFDLGLTVWSVASILLLIAGVRTLIRSLEIIGGSYGIIE